jgi:hypothetical protein
MAMKKTVTPAADSLPAFVQAAASRIPQGPKTFEGFITHVRKARPAIANALENSVCESFPNRPEDDFVVVFSPENASMYQALLTSTASIQELQRLTQEYFGVSKRVLVESKATTEVSIAEKREREIQSREQSAKDAVANHPIIAEARALFGGELGPIELTSKDEGERG